MPNNEKKPSVCNIPAEPDYSKLKQINLAPEESPKDITQAQQIAEKVAEKELGEDNFMLLSFYDKDNDYESPRNASECHANSAIPGYVDYALYRDASLRIDIENGRFVLFYLGL